MPLSPYLSFAGNCADAIAYYQRTLGAELIYKISFGEMPKSAQDSAEKTALPECNFPIPPSPTPMCALPEAIS